MLVLDVDVPNGPERAVQENLADLDGVLVSNPKVAHNGSVRETDGLLITPTGIFVIEAKGTKKGSPNSGSLKPLLNGGWTIGGQPAQFHGNKSPNVQARQAAQTFADYLRENSTMDHFVHAIVSITGDLITMTSPADLGDVTVALDRQLPDALARVRAAAAARAAANTRGNRRPKSTAVTVDQALSILGALELGALMPTREDIVAQGFPSQARGAAATTTKAAPQFNGKRAVFTLSGIAIAVLVVLRFASFSEGDAEGAITEHTATLLAEYTDSGVTENMPRRVAQSEPAIEATCRNRYSEDASIRLPFNKIGVGCDITVTSDEGTYQFVARYDKDGKGYPGASNTNATSDPYFFDHRDDE